MCFLDCEFKKNVSFSFRMKEKRFFFTVGTLGMGPELISTNCNTQLRLGALFYRA